MGGEEACSIFFAVSSKGLPPRGRGRVGLVGLGGRESGITPAWAGKRLSINQLSFLSTDYPRVGGEEIFRQIIILI